MRYECEGVFIVKLFIIIRVHECVPLRYTQPCQKRTGLQGRLQPPALRIYDIPHDLVYFVLDTMLQKVYYSKATNLLDRFAKMIYSNSRGVRMPVCATPLTQDSTSKTKQSKKTTGCFRLKGGTSVMRKSSNRCQR